MNKFKNQFKKQYLQGFGEVINRGIYLKSEQNNKTNFKNLDKCMLNLKLIAKERVDS